MFTNTGSKLLFICLSLNLLSACGESHFNSSSIALKQVPIENTTEEEIENEGGKDTDSEVSNEKNPVLVPVPNPEIINKPGTKPDKITISLRDKVLMNSNISEIALDNALKFYDLNKKNISNKKVITVFDVTLHSSKRRLFVIDMDNGNVTALHSAHGTKSDSNKDGFATDFSNLKGSNQTSLGFMLTAETYYSSKNGLSLRLDGLEAQNDNVRKRLVVIHGANYVNESTSKVGRSYGCPAISHNQKEWYINKAKNGSLLYIYHSAFESRI